MHQKDGNKAMFTMEIDKKFLSPIHFRYAGTTQIAQYELSGANNYKPIETRTKVSKKLSLVAGNRTSVMPLKAMVAPAQKFDGSLIEKSEALALDNKNIFTLKVNGTNVIFGFLTKEQKI